MTLRQQNRYLALIFPCQRPLGDLNRYISKVFSSKATKVEKGPTHSSFSSKSHLKSPNFLVVSTPSLRLMPIDGATKGLCWRIAVTDKEIVYLNVLIRITTWISKEARNASQQTTNDAYQLVPFAPHISHLPPTITAFIILLVGGWRVLSWLVTRRTIGSCCVDFGQIHQISSSLPPRPHLWLSRV